MEIRRAEIFAVGRWNGRQFTAEDLDAIVASFQALGLGGRVPLKFGHTDAPGAPALGWVSRIWREEDKLLADFSDVPRVVYDAIKAGRYKFVSVELLVGVRAGTRELPFVLDAVALLGAEPPAVGTLQDLQALTMRRLPIEHASRTTFSRESPADEVAILRAELERTRQAAHEQLMAMTIERDVATGVCLPAAREAFVRLF